MKIQYYLLIILVSALLFIPFLGASHLFDWDEINFAESAREMLVTGNYTRVQIDFQPFWEKPPLFIWLQALSMHIFGVNEFAARFPNALTGIVTLCALFYIGRKWLDGRLGLLWVLTYVGSFLPHLYFKSGIIDPLFNLFIFLGIYQFVRLSSRENYSDYKRIKISFLAGIFIGLAILTKGPVALLIVLVTMLIFWLLERFSPFIKLKELFIFLLTAGLVSSIWFGLETLKNGPWFLVTFIEYQLRLLTTEDAGHGGPFYYHFLILLLGCFPASIFVFGAFKSSYSEPYKSRNVKKWMIVLLMVVLVIFSIVKTKIVHYSSLAYFPLTFLAAYYLHRMLYSPQAAFKFYHGLLLVIIGFIYSAAFIAIPFINYYKHNLIPYIKDPFAVQALQAKVNWLGIESITGVLLLMFIIIAITFLRKGRSQQPGVVVLFVGTALCIQLVVYLYVPKIEAYSQRAAINFYESKQQEDCYVDVIGFKSYAHLFYKRKPLPADTNALGRPDFLHKDFDKPVYLVAKINNAEGYLRDYKLEKLGEKNGFVFFKKPVLKLVPDSSTTPDSTTLPPIIQ